MVAMKRERILVSACLMGEEVRYDGRAAEAGSELLAQWRDEGRVVSFCPECAAGLPIPRPPAEIRNGHVYADTGEDQTESFERGALLALKLCQSQEIRLALLKENSPSCGSHTVYDGSFSGQLRPGEGLVTRMLREHGIQVFSENELEQLKQALESLES